MNELREIRARNIYNDTAARHPKGTAWPTWEELDDRTREAYLRKADLLRTPGPCEQFMARTVDPWATPILNWLTRKIDKLTQRKKR